MSEGINPNVDVTQESTVESKIGEATNFDQLDRITDEQISASKRASKPKAEPKEEQVSEEVASSEGGEIPPQSTAAEDADINPTLGINPETLKPIKISYGEETLELLPTSEVPVKVDGKEGTATLQDLRDNYSGKVVWDKKFNELNTQAQEMKREQRKFQEEKQFVDERINKFYDLSSEDPIKAFDFLCEISGKDPVEFQQTFRDNLVKQFESYYNMGELDRKEFDLSQRERYFEQKRQSQQQRTEQDTASKQEQAQLQNVLETFGIDEDTFYDVKDDLVKAAPNEQVSAEHVIRYQRALMAQNIVKEVRPDKADDAKILGELATVLVQNPHFTDKDLREIVSEIWKDEPSQANKDLSKKVLKTQAQQRVGQVATKPKGDVWSFDQV
jgi:hypothetical protein